MEQDIYGNLPCIARLAARGYVVAIVQYRESGIGVFPDPVRDARNAIRFMRVNAEKYAVEKHIGDVLFLEVGYRGFPSREF